jgi:PPOX class probable F420-dependent enzyme
MRLDEREAFARARTADHGILATADPSGRPSLVPVCFAIDGDLLASPIDDVKPKSSTDAARLGRVRNLAADPRATLLVEQWDPVDWSRLWWVRLELQRSDEASSTRERLAAALRARYRQYAETSFPALLTFRILRTAGWAATAPVASESEGEASVDR